MKSKSLRSYLLAGLAVWLPIVVTFLILRFIVDLLDVTISFLPRAYQPEQLFGMSIPGLGVILSLLLLIVTGIVATNILGQRLVAWGELLLAKIPLVRSIYNAAKQVIDAMFSNSGQAFRNVLLVEYPRKGMWSLAFQTSVVPEHIAEGIDAGAMVSVFIPTTPNPTSGFIMMVPQNETIDVDMTVDEALKFIISLGVVQSPTKKKKQVGDAQK